MIIDASALLAILFQEPEAGHFIDLMTGAQSARMSAVNYLETAIRIDREGNAGVVRAFEAFMEASGIVIEPVLLSQVNLARLAYAQFGRGRHRAQLNFGDCFAYALAKERGEPLLFKGNDFIHTDIVAAT